MKGYSAQQVRAVEAPHLAAGEPLMERAAAALARECQRVLEGADVSPRHSRVVVLVGGGNNGGDALFAAASLAGRGAKVEVVQASARVHEQALAAALAAGATLVAATAERQAACAATADLIVDGILGTGTSAEPQLRGTARVVVATIVEHCRRHGSQPLVVAVDIPSGIHPDTGEVPESAAVLRADATVTFGGAKAGLLLQPGRSYAGDIRVADIGLAADLEKLAPLVDVPARESPQE